MRLRVAKRGMNICEFCSTYVLDWREHGNWVLWDLWIAS